MSAPEASPEGRPAGADDPAPGRRHWATRTWLDVPRWVWAAATAAALVLVGPGLAPGAWLNLDLVVFDRTPVPNGMWGLGPELPRRVPLWGPLAWLSWLTSGELVGRVLVVAAIVAAVVGAYRLAGRSGLAPLAAATLYGLGPFLATRIAVGHWTVMWTMALLPWAVPTLARPLGHPRRVLWWAAALALGGSYGGIVTGALLLAGLVADRPAGADGWRARRRTAVVAAYLVAQLPWLVPLLVVGADTGDRALADASVFSPPLDGPGDLARILAGHGFWNPPFQIGRDAPVLVAVLGVVLVALAAAGTSRLPSTWRWPVTGVGLASLAVAASSGLPGVDGAVSWFTATPVGAPFRETQRYLAPFLLWLAPAAALGAVRLAQALRDRRPDAASAATAGGVVVAVPLLAGLLLAAPAAWGLGGQLDPVRLPPEWSEARAAVDAEPGTVVALPWYQYFTLDVADDRLVLDVVPYWLGGDVIASSDPNLSRDRLQEVADPREGPVSEVLDAARAGEPVAAALADLGVRWVVVQHDVDWRSYTGVLDDPDLEPVVEGDTLTLYRVSPWRAEVVAEDGQPVATDPVASPWLDVEPSGPARWAQPYQRGWLRGWAGADQAAGGLVGLPAGDGPVWFWPSLVVLAADAVTLAAVALTVVAELRRRRSDATAS